MEPLQPDRPVAGYYKQRLCRGGPWCGVEIWHGPSRDPVTEEPLDRSHEWRAAINGKQVSVWTVWPFCALHPITKDEFDYIRAVSEHAKSDPRAPEHDPKKPVDWLRVRPPKF